MARGRYQLLFLLFISLWTLSSSECAETTRLRKPWHKLSSEERMLFINGFQQLRRDGTLQTFVEAHNRAAFNNITVSIHKSSQVFFWHGYWVWQLESEIRDLGPEYECFSMPYWDITYDGEWWLDQDDPQTKDMPIYNSDLGGEGNLDNENCVEEAPWNMDYYDTGSLCFDDEEEGHCCLKRQHVNGTGSLFGRHDFGVFGYSEDYANFSDYCIEIIYLHGQIHYFIGSVGYSHFHPTGGQYMKSHPIGEPTEDPLFVLFHSFIDYVQMLRADCNQYDLINVNDIENHMPWAYDEYGGTDLDYWMDFGPLCIEGTDRFCTYNSVTPRLMFDRSPNSMWNVVFELGDFWHQNEELVQMCGDNMNGTWWHDEENVMFTDETFTDEKVLSEGGLSFAGFEGAHFDIFATALLVVAFVALVALKWCLKNGESDKLNGTKDTAYGAV